jgi:hypothetical protein
MTTDGAIRHAVRYDSASLPCFIFVEEPMRRVCTIEQEGHVRIATSRKDRDPSRGPLKLSAHVVAEVPGLLADQRGLRRVRHGQMAGRTVLTRRVDGGY